MYQDGPDIYNLFIRMSCLTVPTNLKEIVRYLRFFKGQDGYEMYLKHYLPMLPADVVAEFIEREPEPTTFVVPSEAKTEEVKEEVKVKRTRKPKFTPPSNE